MWGAGLDFDLHNRAMQFRAGDVRDTLSARMPHGSISVRSEPPRPAAERRRDPDVAPSHIGFGTDDIDPTLIKPVRELRVETKAMELPSGEMAG